MGPWVNHCSRLQESKWPTVCDSVYIIEAIIFPKIVNWNNLFRKMENVVKKYNLPFEPSDSHKCEVPSCTFTGMSANSLMTHYYQCHRNDNNFQSSCVFSKRCFHETKFKSYSALKSHTVRFHPSFSLKKTQLTGDVDNVNYNEEILQDDVQQQSISDFMGVNLRLLSRDEDNNGNLIIYTYKTK